MFDSAKEFLRSEDRGVSPVIGVILMVAITVILAAVIATFVMNMGPSEETQPSVQWEWNADSENVTLSHTGGDAATASQFLLETENNGSATLDQFSGISEELTAGDKVVINATGTDGELYGTFSGTDVDANLNSEYTLIWENPNSDQTQVITDFEP
ncbi:type IV pilin [Halorhabdus rudnickae]|uniref:type IV pilin n=1 Tax=Halorhabdus rudnickae TaxID=1775544 RepID=UPI00108416F3|nr:type IV pilin N-terminal domain-containing protein [Halorhabdus rudnickae]